jgi:hypothetical protein
LFSLPAGTEMFHFPAFPPHTLCVQMWVTAHDDCRVSPFGNPRIKAWLTTPRGLSWPPTSFIGSWCQGIHRAPLKTWPQMLASTVQFSNNDQPPVTTRRSESLPGSALKAAKRPYPQTPNSVPDRVPSGDHAFHALLREQYLQPPTRETGRIINVPPMSNQHRTFADVLVLDHQASLAV